MTITTLAHGKHAPSDGKMCMMEAVSFLAGEKFTDQPECVSPVIAGFCRTWNDDLQQENRDRLLLPLLQAVIGTRTAKTDEATRSNMAVDWLVCVYAPAFFDLTPELRHHADTLRSLSPVTNWIDASSRDVVLSAKDAAWNAEENVVSTYRSGWDAAVNATGTAAGNAAVNATWAAAVNAAVNDPWDAAVNATVNETAAKAAWNAARYAARVSHLRGVDLTPTVAMLQASAVDLLQRMCAVGRSTQ